MITSLMRRAVPRMVADQSAANNSRMDKLDAEIRRVQEDLDRAMAAAKVAKLELDLATNKARITALRASGVIQEDDPFGDELEGTEPHGH